MPRSVTVFFPMYNEENNIVKAVDTALEVLLEITDDYEVIIVNDASTDRTGEMADEIARNNTNIRVIHHDVNRKLGGALKSGFYGATKDLVVYSDADFPFDMMELKKAVRVIEHCDIVSAYRFDRTSEGLRRTIYSFVYNSIIRLFFGLRVRDVNFSFKMLRREILKHVEIKSEGSFIDAELLIRANRLGYRIFQIGVDFFPRTRGVSTLSSFSVITKIVKEMFSMFKELRSLRPLDDNIERYGGDKKAHH